MASFCCHWLPIPNRFGISIYNQFKILAAPLLDIPIVGHHFNSALLNTFSHAMLFLNIYSNWQFKRFKKILAFAPWHGPEGFVATFTFVCRNEGPWASWIALTYRPIFRAMLHEHNFLDCQKSLIAWSIAWWACCCALAKWCSAVPGGPRERRGYHKIKLQN